MKRNVIHAIRWAFFIPCALAVALITSIALVYAENLLVGQLTSAPVDTLSRGHLLFEVFLSMLCVYIYFSVGNRITPPTHKRLGNAILFMAFAALEIGFVLSSFSVILRAPASLVALELLNNIVALLAAIGIFFYYHQTLRNLPHKKRHISFKR